MQTYASTLFGHTKIPHTLTGLGSAGPADAVLYPGKATQTSHKGQGSTVYSLCKLTFDFLLEQSPSVAVAHVNDKYSRVPTSKPPTAAATISQFAV